VAAVGRYADLKDSTSRQTDYEGHVITPALVNCHAHLELSHLAILGESPPGPGDMAGWIRGLLAARGAANEPEIVADAARFALARLYAGGCLAVADIGNSLENKSFSSIFKAEVFFFLELLGLSAAAEKMALARLAGLDPETLCSPHAPYSAGPGLLVACKARARRQGMLMPVHVAESAQEVEFLRSGSGDFADFLGERGLDLASFTPPGTSPLAYLASLGLLDAKTLCVHAVQADEADLALLAASGAAVCLCPGSNRFMGVGKAPAERMASLAIPMVLGSDSLASNPCLNLWEEMRFLREDSPGLSPATVFAMATGNGARLLGIADRLGVIAPGVSSSLLAVRCQAADEEEALDYLTSAGRDIRLEWME